MRPALPKPARSIIERQHVVLSRCVFAIGLPDNGILPELDDRQISRFAYRLLVPQFRKKVTGGCPISNTNLDPGSGQLTQFRDIWSGMKFGHAQQFGSEQCEQ